MLSRLYPVFVVVLLALLTSVQSFAEVEDRPIWEQEAMLLYSESSADFTRLRLLGQKNARLVTYSRALEILHEETASNGDAEASLREAQGLFARLVVEGGDDPVSLASRYYLARIAQSNPVELDLREAKKLYLELFEAHPDRFFGQMAFIKYATIEIYDEPEGGAPAGQRLAALEELAAAVTYPDMKRNLHRIMGEGYRALGLDPRRAYEHLVAASEQGQPVESIRRETLESLADVAEQIGETRRALQAYDELLLLDARGPNAERYRAEARRLRGQLDSL